MTPLQLIQSALLTDPRATLSLDPVDAGGQAVTLTFTCPLTDEQAAELEQAQTEK